MHTTTSIALLAAGFLACGTTSGAQQPRSADARADAPVATAHPYELKGKVKSVSGGVLGVGQGVTISREDAPSVRLHVEGGTRVELDGRPASLSDLREGDEVRALFDFRESTPVAIELKAKKG